MRAIRLDGLLLFFRIEVVGSSVCDILGNRFELTPVPPDDSVSYGGIFRED